MRDKPIRILHVVGGMNRGGVENWLMSILRNIDRERFQMDFLVHTTQKCAYDDEIRELGSKTISCPHPSRLWSYAPRFRWILREYGPYHVVHSHVYWFSGYVMRLSYWQGVSRRIVHVYPCEDLKRQSLARRLYRKIMCHWIAEYATGILADSQAALAQFAQSCSYSRHPQAVIYPVVDLSPFNRRVDRAEVRRKYGLPCDLPIVLYVARFFPHKNHKGFLEIARQVNAQGRLAHFVMAGSYGPLLPELQEAAQRRADVSISTGVEDVSELMMACDLFVFPSLNEGFGIVALEAQSAGLPVIATNLPSIREVLAPSLRPLMFEPDALNKAASNIKKTLLNAAYRERLVQEGREWVQDFNVHTSIAELLDFYMA